MPLVSIRATQIFCLLMCLDACKHETTSSLLQTFNEFFIRELKPHARPIASIEREDIAICAADSRLMAFKTVQDCQRFWIKV